MLRRSQKNVPLNGEEATHRKGSSGTIKSEGGFAHSHSSKQPSSDSREPQTPVRKHSFSNTMKVKHISPSGQGGGGVPGGPEQTRFPKLEEYAHFHYDLVEIPTVKLSICSDDASIYKHNTELPADSRMFLVTVTGASPKTWMIRRSLENFDTLDKQLHRCIFDRKFSHLEDLKAAQLETRPREEVQTLLQAYLSHFSELAGGMVNCGSVLSWMEMDNRGHRLVATDDSGINTPAIAAAHVIKRYNAQAADEISLQVGDMISVIDMPSAEDTIWWRGKRGFEVGFFPSECVELIGDKVPASMTSCCPEPLATAAASRKPCELPVEQPSINTPTTTPTTTPSSSTPSPSPSRSSTSTTASSVGTFSLSSSSLSYPDSSPTMIRKHGKLLSFLRTFFSHRPPRNQLKQSGIVKERVFGCDLGEHLLNSGHDVPLLLKSCTDIIEEFGIVHGIYRLSGITSNIQKLRLAFDEDRVPDLTEDCYLQDIHSISSLLKMYFRELPNPLLTYQLYDKFADAVRDEDNKLLKIHDVVQQLPPPHYRTTEYLMRHLARVAAYGHETEMHSKNLAIVWAPNLLRSKELEAGGGAAALQGVGIQAVVTECLICYCDIIFSDKMPNYSNTDNGKGQKKPRPKSLAISTPTRLLSLEEARERAFIGHLAPKKFIDVGGGPKNLPSKYHTVIDLPGYKKKNTSSSKENKPVSGNKKSASVSSTGSNSSGATAGGGGWKSIFSKPRSGSVKKARKSSQESVTLGPAQAKALTEEDVHNWKRHLRSAKSAESLFSMSNTASSRGSSISSRASRSNTETAAVKASNNRKDESPGSGKGPLFQLSHKRSLSSDASVVLRSRQNAQDSSVTAEGNDESQHSSFIRGDSSRKALHRRIPSAPNTPRQERKSTKERSSSVTKEDMSGGEDMDISLEDFIYPKTEGEVNIDAAINSRLLQVAEKTRSIKSNEELTSSPLKRSAKTPPVGRKKAKGAMSSEEDASPTSPRQLPRSPSSKRVTRSSSDVQGRVDGSPYDNDDKDSRMRHFYSRFHDYAEILSDDDLTAVGTPGSVGTMSVSSSGCNMQEVLDQIDTRLAMNAVLFPRHGIGDTSGYRVGDDTSYTKETVFSSGVHTTTTSVSSSQKETEFSVNLPSSSAPPKQTEFPPTGNTSPREVSSQPTLKQLLGLEDSGVDGGQRDKIGGATVVGRRRVEVAQGGGSGKAGSSHAPIYHKGVDKSSASAPTSTRIVRRHAELIPSAKATARDMEDLQDLLNSLENEGFSSSSHRSPPDRSRDQHSGSLHPGNSNSLDSKVTALDESLALRMSGTAMSKCLSVPSDIAKSLENVTESQSDMLSSVTISELSMSLSSFTNGQEGVTPTSRVPPRPDDSDPRRRRSTSLDSLTENDHLMTRTLREINRQMDVAFKHETGSHRLVASDLELSTSPEVKVTPQNFSEVRTSKSVRVRDDRTTHQDELSIITQASSNFPLNTFSSPQPEKKSTSAAFQTSRSYSQSDSDDSLTFVTEAVSSNSLGNILMLSPCSSTAGSISQSAVSTHHSPVTSPHHVRHLHSTATGHQQLVHSPPSSRSEFQRTEEFLSYEQSSDLSIHTDMGYRQTRRQEDDRIMLETPLVVKPRSQCKDPGQPFAAAQSQGALYDNHHQPMPSPRTQFGLDSSEGRCDVANMCRNRLSSSSSSSSISSKSSEEFDEVASPEEDEVPSMLSSPGSGRGRGAVLTQPADRRTLGSIKVDLPQGDVTSYQVVRRQHSPRVEQRSPQVSPRFELNFPSGADHQELDDQIAADSVPWPPNALFSDGPQMNDVESERMSSLCAAGFMSQRVRLSRESSNSSLQSPDATHSNILGGNIRSPLATPVREALPDLVQSTTHPLESLPGDGAVSRGNVPLQLALYHPDEFCMDIPASVSGPPPLQITMHQSPSLPQVHTSSDIVMEKKTTLKKSNTDNCISDQTCNSFEFYRNSSTDEDQANLRSPSFDDQVVISGNLRSTSFDAALSSRLADPGQVGVEEMGFRNRSVAGQALAAAQRMCESLSDTDCCSQDSMSDKPAGRDEVLRRGPTNRPLTGHSNRSTQDHDDEVAMEVDNLCNKLVDDLKSPHSGSSRTDSPAEDSFTVLVSHDVRTDVDEQGAVSMEVETSLEVLGSEPSSPMIRERRLIRSSSVDGDNVETKFVSLESSRGELEQEEVQNALNRGREILMSPEGKDVLDRSAGESLTPTSDSSLPGRKTSFSKIPRPKASPDLTHKNIAGSSSYRSSYSGSMSTSMHADISPSSSSTSSSTSSKTGHSRRGSEASSVTAGKRAGHNRRSSDTKVSDFRTVSPTSRAGLSKSGAIPRGRDTKVAADSKSSRIPLSHRVPSPQQPEAASGLGVGKPQSKIPSPVPKPRKTSSNSRSQQGLPPTDDVIEMTRPSVKRENSGKDVVKKEPGPTSKRTVVVKDIPDKSGAKLVIESQPELKKKIQTVHAKKVNQPPRQLAEALATDSGAEPRPGGLTATDDHDGPNVPCTFSSSTAGPPVSDSKKKESSGKKTPPPVAKRKFHYDSRSFPRRSKYLDSHAGLSQGSGQYSDLVGSRSSLDDSVLQLAAERHDLFVPEDLAEQHMFGLGTGSLRARRSQKMQSLMDLFERGSDSNVSDSSGSPGTRHRDRTYSGSLLGQAGQLTPCLEVGKFDPDTTDDDAFLPASCPQVRRRLSSGGHRSRSRERHPSKSDMEQSQGTEPAKENEVVMRRVPKKSAAGPPETGKSSQGRSSSRDRAQGTTDLRQRASSPNIKTTKGEKLNRIKSPATSEPSSSASPTAAVRSSRPPRYRSNSKSRTYSESSTSESDTTHQAEGSTVRFAAGHVTTLSSSYHPIMGGDTAQPIATRRRTDPKRDNQAKEAKLNSQAVGTPPLSPSSFTPPASPTPPPSPRKSERRNSIKELRQVFEKSESNIQPDPELPQEPQSPSAHQTVQQTVVHTPSGRQVPAARQTQGAQAPAVRPRVRSISPQADLGSEQRREKVNLMRLSLEIPHSSRAPVGHNPELKAQPMRLGPKPFYGTHK